MGRGKGRIQRSDRSNSIGGQKKNNRGPYPFDFRSMQPGMRVVLATAFWLAVLVAGTVGHHPAGRLIFDQYSSPFDPHQYGVYRRAGGQPDWKDQDPVEKNHPFDPSINPPRSITNTGHDFTEAQLHHGAKYLSTDPASRDFSPSSAEEKQPRDPPVDDELVSKKGRAKSREDLSRFEESFVADDTFQDQGPGSLEIYKLDLLRERPLLHGHQVTMFPSGKSKVPKKTSHAAWKPAKTAEYGGRPPPGLPMLLRKQSNSFDEPSTEVPPSADLFGVGGVPELQVGCEGLEAAHYKERRSIDGVRGPRDKARDPWLDVTPITLDLDYEGGGEEEEEEMDELLKLKRLETTTNGVKRNRGDMDAKLHSEFHSDKGAEKLPVRGDLGSSRNNGSSASSARPSRRLLWAAEGGAAHGGEGEGRRRGERGKRALWGFGENEGVAGSDELQTENQRRRMYQERRREQEEEGRRRAESEIERIRGEYERRLDERQREEEERQRRLQQLNRWQLEAEQRRRLEEEEERRREVLEERSREEEERRQREEEARRRKEQEEEMDRRRFKERRREWLLKQRRLEEEEKERNVTAEREWLRKLERNRPIEFAPLPSSPHHHRHHQQQQQQEQRRPDPSMMDRRKEERKLLEYVRRNQPVQVSRANDSYERNLAEQRTQYAIYNSRNGRRNHGPSAPTNIDPSSYAEESRRREAARRIEEEEEKRREREERMREAERREEEVRRRLSRLYEEERRRKEAARLEAERMAKVQREEEERRSMAGGRTREYEDRRRFDHRRRQDLIPANLVLNQSRRPVVERARQRQEEVERRRQEEERRAKEAREREERDRIMKEQWRRQEEARLNALPVSARIIVQPQKPKVISRIGEFDIDFPGANPFQGGVRFPNFPAPPTRRPPVQSPPPCVWAVIQCCPSNQRLVKCFESLGCPGVNWDSNPCRDNVSEAARAQVEKFYRETEDEEERY